MSFGFQHYARASAWGFLVVCGAWTTTVQADRADYWLCVDEHGLEWAQDFPCQPSQGKTPGRGRWAVPSTQPDTGNRVPVPLAPATRGHGGTGASADQANTAASPTIQLPDLLASLRPLIDVLVSLIPWLVILVLVVAVAGVMAARGGLRPKPRGGLAPSLWTILLMLFRAMRRVLKRPPPEHSGRNSKARVPPTVSDSVDVQPTQWTLDLIRALEWRRFEMLCQEIWRARGHRCESTGKGADGGVDLLVYSKQRPEQCIAVVQCKAHTNGTVGVAKVRELYGVQQAQGVNLGILMTSGSFTEDAVAFAKGKRMRLYDRTSVLAAVQAMPGDEQQRLLKQLTTGAYRTPTCPKCEAKMVLRKRNANGVRDYGCPNFPSCRSGIISVPVLKPVRCRPTQPEADRGLA